MLRGGRLLVLAGAIAGVAVAALFTVLGDEIYRADVSIVLVRQGQPPVADPALARSAEAAAELFRSRAVTEAAVANLRLDESADELLDRIDVKSQPDSSLVRMEVDAPSKEAARRTAQEVAEVATVLFNDRFGPETVASIWEAPRAEDDPVAPKPARNLALGALAGALLGQLLLLLRRRRPSEALPAPVRLPVPAGGPPPREPPPPPAPAPDPEPEQPEPELVALPEPVPEPVVSGPFVEPYAGEWTIADVERLLAQEGSAFPELVDEFGWYLDSFHDVADEDGRLPVGVEAVIEDVCGPLLARARAGRRA